MRLTRNHSAALVLVGLVLVACTDRASEKTANSHRSGVGPRASATSDGGPDAAIESAKLQIVDGELRRSMWALGHEVYGFSNEPQKLAGVVHSPLAGTYSPAAAPNPANPRLLAYSSFLKQRPVVRVHDFSSGNDYAVDKSAYSLAWRADGALAYFRGLKPRVRDPARYPGHVVVRRTLQSPPVRWTRAPGRYIVSAWASNRLVVHEFTEEWPNVVVFDGPERKRLLAERATLVALSPDGTRAFITREPDPVPSVSVVDVASGREVASLILSGELGAVSGERIYGVAHSGSWVGDSVISAVSGGLAVFRVTKNEIVLEHLLGVDPEAFPTGLTEPKSDDANRYVIAVAELMQRPRAAFTRTALIECDLVEHTCVLGQSAPSYQPPRPIYNPSRPQD